MGPLFTFSLRQLASRGRLLLLLILVSLPVGLAILVSATIGEDETSNREFINTLLDGLLIGTIMPIVSMVLATAAFGNEVEDRTLSFLVLKPISRLRIVSAKLLAAIAVGCPLVIVSGLTATLVGGSGPGARIVELDGTFQATLAVGVALFAGFVAYCALFTWAGLVSTRALPYALVYVVIWEGLISSILDGVRYLSVRGYTLAIMHGLDDKSFAELSDRVIEFPAGILGVVIVTAGFLWLAVRRLDRMDVT
ncbi:MAG: ABC transporter permease [Dehalococcoidia bacterium]